MADPSPDFRFPRIYRLRLRYDFDRVFRNGQVASDETLVIHAIRNDLPYSRLGVSISKRVGSAPVRNRWKRWIREAFRLHRHELGSGIDFVIRPRREAIGNQQAIENSLTRLARKLERRLG